MKENSSHRVRSTSEQLAIESHNPDVSDSLPGGQNPSTESENFIVNLNLTGTSTDGTSSNFLGQEGLVRPDDDPFQFLVDECEWLPRGFVPENHEQQQTKCEAHRPEYQTQHLEHEARQPENEGCQSGQPAHQIEHQTIPLNLPLSGSYDEYFQQRDDNPSPAGSYFTGTAVIKASSQTRRNSFDLCIQPGQVENENQMLSCMTSFAVGASDIACKASTASVQPCANLTSPLIGHIDNTYGHNVNPSIVLTSLTPDQAKEASVNHGNQTIPWRKCDDECLRNLSALILCRPNRSKSSLWREITERLNREMGTSRKVGAVKYHFCKYIEQKRL